MLRVTSIIWINFRSVNSCFNLCLARAGSRSWASNFGTIVIVTIAYIIDEIVLVGLAP